MIIRPMKEEDLKNVHEIEQASFTMAWSFESFQEVLQSSYRYYIVAEEEGQILGFAGMSLIVDEADIENIAVSKEHRRQGLGRELLKALKAQALEQDMSVMFLEVRVSNTPAVCLYESEGFVPVGRRKDYYEAPREDALLYALKL